MNNEIKQEIISYLQQVPTDTILGTGINLFIQQVELKTDADYKRVVMDLKQQMIDGPKNMQKVLGTSYDYFKNFPAAELSS